MTSRPPQPVPSDPVDRRVPRHPLVTAAAAGRLPEWAEVGSRRREHMERVAALLDSWAERLELADAERARWRAVAYLHDVLRDADPARLRTLVSGTESLPDPLLHGPAAAELLRGEGVTDEELLAAVAYHTLGDPTFGRLGRALYAADFLEPGRTFLVERRAELRARAPQALDAVVRDVVRERLGNQLRRGMSLHPRTVAFWNALAEEPA